MYWNAGNKATQFFSKCITTIIGDVMVSNVADKEEVVLMTEGVLRERKEKLLTLVP